MVSLKVPMTRNFVLFEKKTFKMMKNGVYFTVIAVLVAELFKTFIFPNEVTCDFQLGTESGVMSEKNEYLSRRFLYRTQT